VRNITAGETGAILFNVQLSDGSGLCFTRTQLEDILCDVDIRTSSQLKKVVVHELHSSVALFAQSRLKKTTDCSEFLRYSDLLQAFQVVYLVATCPQ
jgi:hypothetical protein